MPKRPTDAGGLAWRPPRWAAPVTSTLAVLGLALSAYLTYAHYTTAAVLSCPDTGTINCEKVTTSAQSVIFGIFPVAVVGLAYYLVVLVACSPPAWRRTHPAVRWGRLGLLVAGFGMVLYLVYAELFQINAICIYCSSVHFVTFLLLGLVAVATLWVPLDDGDDTGDDVYGDELAETGPAG